MKDQDIFDKLRVRRSVFKRTRARADLPTLVLYMEWLSGQMKRRVIDTEGNEHLLDDTTLQSNYKLVSGAQAKMMLTHHWPAIAQANQNS